MDRQILRQGRQGRQGRQVGQVWLLACFWRGMGQEQDRKGIGKGKGQDRKQEVAIYPVVVVVRDWGCRNDYVILEKGEGRRQEEINVSVSVGQMDRWIMQTDAEGLTAYRYMGIRITGSFSFPFFSFLPPLLLFLFLFSLFLFPFSFLFSFPFLPLLPLLFVFYLQSSILNI